jgi:hypothetical protein
MENGALLIHNLDAVFPVTITGSHRIKSCGDPWPSLDYCEKRNPFGSTGIRTPDCQYRSLKTTISFYCILGITFNIPIFRGCEYRCTIRKIVRCVQYRCTFRTNVRCVQYRCTVRTNVKCVQYPLVTQVGVVIQLQIFKVQISHE